MFPFLIKLVLKTVLIDKPLHLQIDHIIEFSPSHPVRQHNNQGHITELHIIGGLVEVSLLKADVVLLTVQVAPGGKVCHALLVHVVAYLPLLSLAEFVDYADYGAMAVGSEVFLTDFPEYPASRAIFTVNKLINLDLIVIKINIMRIMFGNKIRKIKFELVRDHNIRIPE